MNDISEADIRTQTARIEELRAAIAQAIVGQSEVVEQLLIGLLAGGHCLLEGVPGLGKTLLVRTLGQAMRLQFRRVQFTPDLMPSDLLGTELLEEDHGTGHRHFRFQRGPVFTNLLLADELNRTPPKTQAALLEAMQERTVSFAGATHELPAPFFVLATQNPIEQAGTYPLPEAQLDRFLLQIRVGYPNEDEERSILVQTTGARTAQVPQVMDGDQVLALQALTRQVHVGDDLLGWINRLVRATRPGEGAPEPIARFVRWGAGPRAGQSLVLASKARALLHGRLAATREDVTALVAPVMRHRLLLSFAAEAEQVSTDDVIAALLRDMPMPAA
ncbi:AAA domain-containing protein [Lysobacter maris]|uniref:AAA domain-containing protein n=1 Tax=Marilutibacter maris TaxID=1605891 RepID=A0A508AG99_9GAMM|nr:MoxR family ATPase [Lysobacter maris]KAB8176387.1 AAA domain-containing protein [Lysobacter maris]